MRSGQFSPRVHGYAAIFIGTELALFKWEARRDQMSSTKNQLTLSDEAVNLLDQKIEDLALPADFADSVENFYVPLAASISHRISMQTSRPTSNFPCFIIRLVTPLFGIGLLMNLVHAAAPPWTTIPPIAASNELRTHAVEKLADFLLELGYCG